MSARRTSTGAAAAAVLGLTLLAPTSAATAAAVTCRGQAPTIVHAPVARAHATSAARLLIGARGRTT